MVYAWLVTLFVIAVAVGITALFLFGLWKVLTSPVVRNIVARLRKRGEPPEELSRPPVNPVLRPGHYPWEASAVLNPGAIDIGGRVHLFYRAIGADGISRVGYSSSRDGIHFEERLPYPVFALDGASVSAPEGRLYMETMYPYLVASGGSWGGVEDPRAVVIDNRVYLTFSAFYNWNSIRIGVVSLSVEDLLNKRWRWSRPVFLSPPDAVRKNWVLFPEKINGQFALWHAFLKGDRNRAMIEYLPSLEHDPAPYITGDPSFMYEYEEGVWDSRMRSIGPPPLKTAKGWLVLYHANDVREPHKYKLGALLLSHHDPSVVVARASGPVLSPNMVYENDGKPGIVYACGAVIRGDALFVYYGGADSVVCVGESPLSELLASLDPL